MELYNYLFWYNDYDKVWYGIHRDTQILFFNGNRKDSLYFKDIKFETVIELIKDYENPVRAKLSKFMNSLEEGIRASILGSMINGDRDM